jgi:Tfp pilus assembly protein PilX
MRAKRQNNRESGMAMVLVITILAALLGIAAIGLSLQLNSTKSTALIKDTRAALYCAEAGLAASRVTIIANRNDWNDILDGTGAPWYSAVAPLGLTGDANGDGTTGDYSVTFVDDGDDADPATDSNDTIVITSTCLLFPTAPASVTEVVSLLGQGHVYRNQGGGGAGNTGNQNVN